MSSTWWARLAGCNPPEISALPWVWVDLAVRAWVLRPLAGDGVGRKASTARDWSRTVCGKRPSERRGVEAGKGKDRVGGLFDAVMRRNMGVQRLAPGGPQTTPRIGTGSGLFFRVVGQEDGAAHFWVAIAVDIRRDDVLGRGIGFCFGNSLAWPGLYPAFPGPPVPVSSLSCDNPPHFGAGFPAPPCGPVPDAVSCGPQIPVPPGIASLPGPLPGPGTPLAKPISLLGGSFRRF